VSFPDALLEVEFTDGEWTDITSEMRTFSFGWGRSRDIDRPEAGTSTLVLDNFEREFEPANPDGPYYPNVRPMRRIRLRAIVDSDDDPFYMDWSYLDGPDLMEAGPVYVPLFTHFAESWKADWPANGFDATATVQGVDAFKVLSLTDLNMNASTSYGGARIGEVLDEIGWPEDERDLEAGSVQLLTGAVEGSALEHLLTVAQTGGGLFFVAADGKLTFFDRDHPVPAPFEFGTAVDDEHFEDVGVSSDETQLWNDITVTSPGTTDQHASDARSIDRYYTRSLSFSTLHASNADRGLRSRELIVSYRDPQQRITQLSHVRWQDDWRAILSARLFDPVTVTITPPGGGEIIQSSRIERISIQSNGRQDWRVTWDLSAVPRRNLLTDELQGDSQTSSDFGLVGWMAETNCAVSVEDSFGFSGLGELVLTSSAAGDMSARTTPDTQIPVVVGQRYVASAYLRNASLFAARSVGVELSWRDSAGDLVSDTAGDLVTQDFGNPPEWVGAWVEGTAPVDAAFVTVRLVVEGTTAGGEPHYADLILLTEDD
jgi:hypothetical protein